MKALWLVLFLVFASNACGRLENFTNLAQQKIETEKTGTEQPDEPPILEIISDAQGMWTVTGKTLFFNLYENGVIEFEYRDEKKLSPGRQYKAEEINILERAKLSDEELKEFTDLLKTEAFQNVRNEYQNICRSTDAHINYKIDFQSGGRQKNITLVSYCGSEEVRNPKSSNILDFPKVLSDLIDLAGRARSRRILEKSSNQPR